jgi:hypothetical protein
MSKLLSNVALILILSYRYFFTSSAFHILVHHSHNQGVHVNNYNINENQKRDKTCRQDGTFLRKKSSSSILSSSSSLSCASVDNDDDAATNVTMSSFWGKRQTKETIRRHVANIIFPNEEYIHTRKRINVISNELPLITVDNFLPDEMCQDIIQASISIGQSSNKIKPSTMGVNQTISTDRTSSTVWLHEQECEIPLRILASKISRLTGFDASHMENLQVVKYETGQKFEMHTDHLGMV